MELTRFKQMFGFGTLCDPAEGISDRGRGNEMGMNETGGQNELG